MKQKPCAYCNHRPQMPDLQDIEVGWIGYNCCFECGFIIADKLTFDYFKLYGKVPAENVNS